MTTKPSTPQVNSLSFFIPGSLRANALGAGALLVGTLLLAALLGALRGTEFEHALAHSLATPSIAHWFGCDPYGVDLGNRILAGAWQSIKIALIVTTATIATGLLVGTGSAASSPWIRLPLIRLTDCVLAFPGLLLAILLAAILPQAQGTLVFALVATHWTSHARFCRAHIESKLGEPYIESARAAGAPEWRIMVRHIWPSLTGPLSIQAALSMGHVILAEASLSYLGLGGSMENPSWGRLIAEGREYLVEAPHLSIFPGLAFIVAVFGFTLLAEGLRNRLDRARTLGVY